MCIAPLSLLRLEALDGREPLPLHCLLASLNSELHLFAELSHRPQLTRLLLPLRHVLLEQEPLANLLLLRLTIC